MQECLPFCPLDQASIANQLNRVPSKPDLKQKPISKPKSTVKKAKCGLKLSSHKKRVT